MAEDGRYMGSQRFLDQSRMAIENRQSRPKPPRLRDGIKESDLTLQQRIARAHGLSSNGLSPTPDAEPHYTNPIIRIDEVRRKRQSKSRGITQIRQNVFFVE